MKSPFEPILEIQEYFDGPRIGIADFNGRPHTFRSRLLDAKEYKDNIETLDTFELTPIEGSSDSEPILARAEFRALPGQESLPHGQIRKMEVSWQQISTTDT